MTVLIAEHDMDLVVTTSDEPSAGIRRDPTVREADLAADEAAEAA